MKIKSEKNMDTGKGYLILVFNLFLVFIMVFTSSCNTYDNHKSQNTTNDSTSINSNIKLETGEFILMLSNDQKEKATVYRINRNGIVSVYEKSNYTILDDVTNSQFWHNVKQKNSFKLKNKEYNSLKKNINKVFIKEYEYEYTQDGDKLTIVTNNNQKVIVASYTHGEEEIERLSYNIISALNTYY